MVSNFTVQALRGAPITIHGDGSHTRSFCCVDGLVDGFTRMMASPDEVTGPVNPGEFTVRELAERILTLAGSRSATEHRPPPENDPAQRRPGIAKAKAPLDWTPTIPLDQGLVRAVDHFEALLSKADADL